MAYNFDRVPDRRLPGVVKWTYYPQPDLLPFWVADMDFPAPKPILNAIRQAVRHGVLGYELPSNSLLETVAARMERLHGWKVKPEWVITVTGIVNGFNIAARAFGSSQKGYLIQPPVYNEFHSLENNLGLIKLDAPLVKRVRGNLLYYEVDWELFQSRVKEARIFLLCNPHNPLGTIFSRNDLRRMAEICLENRVLIISDEIHSELLLEDKKFTPIATLSKEIAQNTITLVAPSKTFNIPGLFCGFAIIPNKELRDQYAKVTAQLGVHVASLGLRAAQAAYSGQCDDWLKELRCYLTGNRDFLIDYVTKNMPGVRITKPQATYLAWLDFTESEFEKSPFEFFLEKARVALVDGKIYGENGQGHVRLNFGTSRRILKQGLERMSQALHSL